MIPTLPELPAEMTSVTPTKAGPAKTGAIAGELSLALPQMLVQTEEFRALLDQSLGDLSDAIADEPSAETAPQEAPALQVPAPNARVETFAEARVDDAAIGGNRAPATGNALPPKPAQGVEEPIINRSGTTARLAPQEPSEESALSPRRMVASEPDARPVPNALKASAPAVLPTPDAPVSKPIEPAPPVSSDAPRRDSLEPAPQRIVTRETAAVTTLSSQLADAVSPQTRAPTETTRPPATPEPLAQPSPVQVTSPKSVSKEVSRPVEVPAKSPPTDRSASSDLRPLEAPEQAVTRLRDGISGDTSGTPSQKPQSDVPVSRPDVETVRVAKLAASPNPVPASAPNPVAGPPSNASTAPRPVLPTGEPMIETPERPFIKTREVGDKTKAVRTFDDRPAQSKITARPADEVPSGQQSTATQSPSTQSPGQSPAQSSAQSPQNVAHNVAQQLAQALLQQVAQPTPNVEPTAPVLATTPAAPVLEARAEARIESRIAPQIESAIEHLSDAREIGRKVRPELNLRHAEFGAVNVRLEAAGGDVRATLSARDPGFAPAIQAALAERMVFASSETNAGQSQRSPDQRSQDSSSTYSQGGSNSQSGPQSDPRYGSSTGSGQASSQPYSEQTGLSDEEAGTDPRAEQADLPANSARSSGLFA